MIIRKNTKSENQQGHFPLKTGSLLVTGFIFLCITITWLSCARQSSRQVNADVLIAGGGASGVMAAIQAARMGVHVILIEETPWLGGMISAAGVSAIDGNYKLHSGLWEEFRLSIYAHYGGPDQVRTGWVSNVMFEPQVAAGILDSMSLPLENLEIYRNSRLEALSGPDDGWKASIQTNRKRIGIRAKVVIDATELGDVLSLAGIPYDIGMDSREKTGEEIAPTVSNDIIQDLTYVAILKDFGNGIDRTVKRPENYDPSGFRCTCAGYCDPDSIKRTLWDCQEMMNYGKLPNGYYMINWPIFGNDYYANVIELDHHEREAQLQKAKDHTLSYVYYLQHELGFRNLGLAEDVFPTRDHLPLIPYYRESRRMRGMVRFTLNDLAKPYGQENPLYRTGIAVGDYPVDHHHSAYPDHKNLPDLHFYPVPSYTIPLGALIPGNSEFFIVAEKSISVTNLVNGTTRLQPVCMLIGQAAGTLAALSVQEGTTPADVPVRKVQQALLQSGAYLLPFSDVRHDDPVFNSIQRIGATGILRGEGKNIGWENHTYIYPDSMMTRGALVKGLDGWLETAKLDLPEGEAISLKSAMNIIMRIAFAYNQELKVGSPDSFYQSLERICQEAGLDLPAENEPIDRKTFAFLLDRLVDPFTFREVDHRGHFME